MCLATLVFTLLPGSDSPKFRKIKGTLYITVGLLAGGVSFHGGLSKDPNVQMDLLLWALGGGIYISGSILYILRFPEKLSPGKFDYVVTSLYRELAISCFTWWYWEVLSPISQHPWYLTTCVRTKWYVSVYKYIIIIVYHAYTLNIWFILQNLNPIHQIY